jgi:hypothetical protein
MGIHAGDGYVNTFDVVNTEVVGCARGIVSGGSVNGINMTGGVLQNEVDIDRVHSHLLLDGVEFRGRSAPYPSATIENGDRGQPARGQSGMASTRFPTLGFPRSTFNRGSDLIVKNCKGFRHHREELSSVFQSVARRSPGMAFVVSPVARLQPAAQGSDNGSRWWDQLGMGYLGGVVDPTQALTLDGLLYGTALEGTTTALGRPRAKSSLSQQL